VNSAAAPVWRSDRAVLHVDMDAFYASVEERDDPSLRGRPVIVGGPKEARGVVSAASYAARAFGVRSAMPLRVAARLCPDGVFLPVRMARYAEVSAAIFAIFGRFSPLVEPLSIDEAFLDATGSERLFGGPVRVAERIRGAIRAETGLTASVGVASNKFVAKIASDLRKPDGLVVVPPEETRAFLAPLPVERMWGVGPRGAETLRRAGIRTFGDLAAAEPARLRALFGLSADGLRGLARGEDARPVVPDREAKSVGRETTFPEDLEDRGALRAALVALVDDAASRLRGQGLLARVVTLKVRYAPFVTRTRRTTLEVPAHATRPLLDAAKALFRGEVERDGRPVRLLGVSFSGFTAQGLLFGGADGRLDEAIDAVRRRFGSDALRRAAVLDSGSGSAPG